MLKHDLVLFQRLENESYLWLEEVVSKGSCWDSLLQECRFEWRDTLFL